MHFNTKNINIKKSFVRCLNLVEIQQLALLSTYRIWAVDRSDGNDLPEGPQSRITSSDVNERRILLVLICSDSHTKKKLQNSQKKTQQIEIRFRSHRKFEAAL